jgi:hypothetical protein
VAKDLVRAAGDQPVVSGDGWATNVDLLLASAPHTKRIETLPLAPRWDLRPRESRVRWWPDSLALFRYARAARARAPRPVTPAAR